MVVSDMLQVLVFQLSQLSISQLHSALALEDATCGRAQHVACVQNVTLFHS